MQRVWKQVRTTFEKLCPDEVLLTLKCGVSETDYVVNRIHEGLHWHNDMVKPNQDDPTLTVPGITCVIHLGADPTDLVVLELEHDKSEYDLLPGMMYAFPGYALSHRTRRRNKFSQPRYSLVISFNVRPKHFNQLDQLIHSWYSFTNDSYCDRYKNQTRNNNFLVGTHQNGAFPRV